MKNSIIVPFDLNTARKIKSGEIEGSVLINNIEIEFVYESKDCAGPYNLLFVRKDEYGISAIYANTEGCALGDTTLELRVEAGAYFKEGDILTSTKGCQFIYDGLITEGAMGSICGMTTYGDIEFDRCTLWTDVYSEDKNRNVRKAIEEEKKFLAEKIIKAEDGRKINIIKRYLSEYEYLLDEMPKHDFKPFGFRDGYKGPVKTILLQDVLLDGKIVTDHLWFDLTKGFESADLLPGDVVEFCARVSIYEKGYKGYRNDVFDRPIEKDYRLSRPTKIKKIGKKSI